MRVKIFTPPKFDKKDMDIKSYLNSITGKNWHYASSGKASIYHILKPLNIKNIIVPAYVCSSVLKPIKMLNIEPIFCDIDTNDLNICLQSIQKISQSKKIDAVLVPSLYGIPANLSKIQQFCFENNIFMIDDAAQSFGAMLEGKYVGTFGNAGFFSFGAGKATAGHMGGFFWSECESAYKKRKFCLFHYIKYINFYFNRVKIYNPFFKILGFFTQYLDRLINKFYNFYFDDICKFEKKILGGILFCNMNGKFDFRKHYFDDFVAKFSNNTFFNVINYAKWGGDCNPHKIILIFYDIGVAKIFASFMINSGVYVSNGYFLLSNIDLPNANFINGKVMEIPIENDSVKMKYIFDKVGEFYVKNS